MWLRSLIVAYLLLKIEKEEIMNDVNTDWHVYNAQKFHFFVGFIFNFKDVLSN